VTEHQEHPAEWAPRALEAIPEILRRWGVPDGGIVLDPYGGVGNIHKLVGYETISSEREAAWHLEAERRWPGRRNLCVPILDLGYFGELHAVVTSPTWGNRMADTYMGGSDEMAGREPSKRSRRTYPIALGYVPDVKESTCALQWGDDYRLLHERHLRHMAGLLRPGGVLVIDIADHQRGKRRQRVTDWWEKWMRMWVGPVEERHCVEAPRWTFGANTTRYPETLLVAVRQ